MRLTIATRRAVRHNPLACLHGFGERKNTICGSHAVGKLARAIGGWAVAVALLREVKIVAASIAGTPIAAAKKADNESCRRIVPAIVGQRATAIEYSLPNGNLPPQQHQHRVILLREVEELSYRNIAFALNVPEGTVGSRLNRARHELQRHLGDLLQP